MSQASNYGANLFALLWALGGITAILVIANKEKKRLGGRFFSHIIEDIGESPFSASLGYSFVFFFSWVSVIIHLFIEKD